MIVIDSSFFLANVFNDENNLLVIDVFNKIDKSQLEAIVPNIFFYEIHNSLLTAVRRKRIPELQLTHYLDLFAIIPFYIENQYSGNEIIKLALLHDLSFYDASYLAVAVKRNIPLATLDKKLINAAKKENLLYE